MNEDIIPYMGKELEFYKQRNELIMSQNEMLLLEIRDANRTIRVLNIAISRMSHPAGRKRPPGGGKYE
jgi:hypothetical protein